MLTAGKEFHHHEVSAREQLKSEFESFNENEHARDGAETPSGTTEAVESEPCLEACGATGAILIESETNRYGGNSIQIADDIYENLYYYQHKTSPVREPDVDLDFSLNKSLILNKFFRSTERNYAAYENLCTGCGYGVFEARGRLCNFCQCIVHGSQYAGREAHTNGNIYENICEKCASIFSSDECEYCQIAEKQSQRNTSINTSKSDSIDYSCADTAKSKNDNAKPDKKGFLQGIIGSLRRIHVKTSSDSSQALSQNSPAATDRRVQIIHNVEGFDNVFRTQESFDLEKICELKRNQTSNSDQHIYGRLKQRPSKPFPPPVSATLPATLSQSHDQLRLCQSHEIERSPKQVVSADCLNSSVRIGTDAIVRKKSFRKLQLPLPLIRKFRPLDPRSQSKQKHKQVLVSQVKQSLYLDDNICQWMTSLRREIHYYESFPFADDIVGCDAKSIPTRHSLTYGQFVFGSKGSKEFGPTHLRVTDIDDPSVEEITYKDLHDINCEFPNTSNGLEFPTVLSKRNDSIEFGTAEVVRSHEQQMIEDFIHAVMSKQSLPQQQQLLAGTGTEPITKRCLGSALTAPISRSLPVNVQDRAKRKAIYLKPDDTTRHYESTANANNQCNDFNQHDTNSNYLSQSQSQQVNVRVPSPLASHCFASQPIVPSSDHCGNHERDSEFVNDILYAFEHFLRRETDEAERNLTIADVAAKREVTGADLSPPITAKNSEVLIGSAICIRHRAVGTETAVRALTDCERSTATNLCNASPLIPLATVSKSSTPPIGRNHLATTLNVVALISDLLLSRSLNCVVVYYDKPLSAFLRCLHQCERYREKYSSDRFSRHLVRKYERFVSYCERYSLIPRDHVDAVSNFKKLKPDCESVRECLGFDKSVSLPTQGITDSSIESNVEGCVISKVDFKSAGSDLLLQHEEEEKGEETTIHAVRDISKSETKSSSCCYLSYNDLKQDRSNESLKVELMSNELDLEQVRITKEQASETKVVGVSVESKNCALEAYQMKPKVPVRDPKTRALYKVACQPPRPAKRQSQIHEPHPEIMRVPTSTSDSKDNAHRELVSHKVDNDVKEKEEKEKNEHEAVAEEEEESIYQPIWKFKTLGEVQERYHTDADYYEFEESNHLGKLSPIAANIHDSSTLDVPAILISNSIEDHGEWETDDEFMFATQRQLQLEESTSDAIESYDARNCTLRSTCSGSSITGSTVTGFASTSSITIGSAVSTSLMHHLFRSVGIFFSLTDPKLRAIIYDYDRVYATTYFAGQVDVISNRVIEDKSAPSPRISSTPISEVAETRTSFPASESENNDGCQHAKAPVKRHLLSDSVQAWKFMLLDVNYLEDEEDMIVSEAEILRAQQPKGDDIDARHQQHSVQRFKSASIGNLIDLPTEEDKKSIAERMRNKLQRGVFRLNVRSPKSEKKIRNIFRRAEATSLYLEEGVKPKYPIFGAALDVMELNQSTQPNVPRFVVDCIEYIERKDCIQQDGLYRASGNKVQVDELKQKICDSYIYHPKLLVCDDIHTLTSLLKQFFRELGAPLIPQETYERLGPNLTDEAGIENLKSTFYEMREPNRSTLKFLIEHLTHVASHSSQNRMPASNLAIVWGPCLLSANQIEYNIARMNTLAKVLIEYCDRIFYDENERLVC